MPQSSPMNWLALFTMFVMNFSLIKSYNSNMSKMTKKKDNSSKNKMMKWKF